MKKLFIILVILFSLKPIAYSQGSLTLESSKAFQDYRQFFTYVAQQNNLNVDENVLLKLAADSETNYLYHQNNDSVWVVKANYYHFVQGKGRPPNQLRGASDNGLYYVVRRETDKIILIGILEGNRYEFFSRSVMGKDRSQIKTHWHTSASEGQQLTHEWNEDVFKPTLSTSETHYDEQAKK